MTFLGRYHRAGLFGVIIIGILGAETGRTTVAPRPFTVVDSIQMNAIADPDIGLAQLLAPSVKMSPDGRWFVIVSRRGDVETGRNRYTLILYDVAVVRAALNGGALPAGRALAVFESASNSPGIGSAKWLYDNRTVAFLGENPGEVAQVYTVDIRTGSLTRRTAHPTDVVAFDIQPGSERIIYSAIAPRDWSQRIARGYAVDTEPLHDVLGAGARSLFPTIAYFIADSLTSPVRSAQIAPYLLVGWPREVWLSPSGRWSIALEHVDHPPDSWWRDYGPVARATLLQGANDPENRRFALPHPNVFLQFMLIDMRTGAAEPLIDAPSGIIFGGSALSAHWSVDEGSVVLANTFLPLNETDAGEVVRRQAAPSIAEVDLHTRAVRRIVDVLQDPGRGTLRAYAGSQRIGDRLVIHWAGGIDPTTYVRRGRNWTETTNVPRAAISVRVDQSLNRAPEIRATELATGRSRIVTDLNPQLRSIAMGTAETIRWSDPSGREWIGGLIKPPGYITGQRYPLVILTHGYDPDSFLVDGPGSSVAGFAARALAGRDMIVLQVRDGLGPSGDVEEARNQVAGYKAIIERLDREGLIDRARVGIHGWSRTGYYVQEAITFSDLQIAAASVSDPSFTSVFKYVTFFGLWYPGMLEAERMMGLPLWGEENARVWAERDPSFNLHRIRTPLRIEDYGGHAVWWDIFAILRRQGRPVEYWSYPDAEHNPVKPWERLSSQGGTVDWYDFWLNDREDPDPAKAEQYARWRRLRQLHLLTRDTSDPNSQANSIMH